MVNRKLLDVEGDDPGMTQGDLGFSWLARDSATGMVLTKGHATVAGCYEAVLDMRLRTTIRSPDENPV